MCASLVNVFGHKKTYILDRSLLLVVFLFLYLAFVIMFGMKLRTWNNDIPGKCYNTNRISIPTSSHPYVDNIYLSLTCLYFVASMWACLQVAISAYPRFLKTKNAVLTNFEFIIEDHENLSSAEFGLVLVMSVIDLLSTKYLPPKLRRWWVGFIENIKKQNLYYSFVSDNKSIVLLLALIQYPLHTYMVIALRQGNDKLLDGDSENYWGFGQVIALISLASSVLQGVRLIAGTYIPPTLFRYRKRVWLMKGNSRISRKVKRYREKTIFRRLSTKFWCTWFSWQFHCSESSTPRYA